MIQQLQSYQTIPDQYGRGISVQASVSVNSLQLLYCQEPCTLIIRPTPKQKSGWVITYKCFKISGFYIPKAISMFDFLSI